MSCFTPTLTRGLVSNLDDMPNGMKPLSFFQAVSLQLCLFFFFFKYVAFYQGSFQYHFNPHSSSSGLQTAFPMPAPYLCNN